MFLTLQDAIDIMRRAKSPEDGADTIYPNDGFAVGRGRPGSGCGDIASGLERLEVLFKGGKFTSGVIVNTTFVRNFPCQTLKISKVSLVVMGL
jgi:hypothetical protein